MATYLVKLKAKKEIAFKTLEFSVDRPKGYKIQPGQHLSFFISDNQRNSIMSHVFSFVNEKHAKEITLATRLRSQSYFKQQLKRLKLGQTVKISEARGNMILPPQKHQSLVFLAGGIGITPFMSMIRTVVHDKLPFKIYLFYSVSYLKEAAYLQELHHLAVKHKNINLIVTVTRATKTKNYQSLESGRLNLAILKKYLKSLRGKRFFLAGPPTFVLGLQELLQGEVPFKYIQGEEFGGY